jgi:hypothetical protein
MLIDEKKLKGRKVAIFGTGIIAKSLVEENENFKPDLFLDNYPKLEKMFGVDVVKPKKVANIYDVYIIVATMSYEVIKKQLLGYGLKEIEDFCYYKTITNNHNTVIETLIKLRDFMSQHSEYVGCDLMNGFFLTGRKKELLINFFKEYAKKNTKYIFIAHTTAISEEKASDLLENVFFELPDILNWQGNYREFIEIDKEEKGIEKIELDDDDIRYINDLQSLYYINDIKLSVRVCFVIMRFYKELLAIVKPSHILIGTDIKPEWRVLYYLAKKNKIQCLFWEYGWIPGTIMFELDGSAGRSRIAKDALYYKRLSNNYDLKKLQVIKRYILETGIDTGEFLHTQNDKNELKKINPNCKTIFLIGAGIEREVKSSSYFWKENISSIYGSMNEILEDLDKICKKNNYNLIFKPHPGISNISSLKEAYSDVIWIENMSVDEIIKIADVAVTLYSAVDCKVLLYEKPLIQVGHSILDNAGCSYVLKNRGEIIETTIKAINNGLLENQKKHFDELMGKLLTNISWDDLNKEGIKYGIEVEKDFFVKLTELGGQ